MKYYIGYAKDPEIRSRGAGGGVVTALLLYLLRSKKVDGVIVCGSVDTNLNTKMTLVTDEKDVIDAAQSKYIDFTLENIVKQLREDKSNKKYAVVGVSCNFRTLKSFVSDKIIYWFGLYCGVGLKKEGTEAALKRLNVKKDDVAKLDYRYGKDYGGFRVTLKDGSTKYISKDAFNYLFTLYMPLKCFPCDDFFNAYADVSFGDCWFKKNYTSILPWNQKGLDLIKEADTIEIEEIEKHKFFDQHKHSVKLKANTLDMRKYKWIMEKTPLPILELSAKIMKKVKKFKKEKPKVHVVLPEDDIYKDIR